MNKHMHNTPELSEGDFNCVRPEFFCGNIFIRPNYLAKKGVLVGDHTHNFDHTTFVTKGSVHVKAKHPDGTVIERQYKAGEWFLVKAEVRHEIMALENDTAFACIYSHRNAQGEIVVERNGWENTVEEAYS